jgi:plasmid stability protein
MKGRDKMAQNDRPPRRLRCLTARHRRSVEREARAFLNDLHALRQDPRKAVRHAFSFVEEALLAEKLEVCERALQLADPRLLDVTTATGLLAVTLQAKGKLCNRDDYYARVEAWLRKERPEDVEGLLEGLR